MTKKILPIITNIEGDTLTFKGGSQWDMHGNVMIDPNDLSGEFASQAANYGYIAARLAEAEWAKSRAKVALEQLSAQLDVAYRECYRNRDEKVTEAVIKSNITLDEDYMELQEHNAELDYHVDVLKGASSAMKQRGDMLVSLGAQTRAELELTGSHINEYSEDLMKNAKKILANRRHNKSS